MAQTLRRNALRALAVVALSAVVADARTTTTAAGFGKCFTYVCPSGYKSVRAYENKDCLNATCNLYDRDRCCRKKGWPWWGWLLLAIGCCCFCIMCFCPASLAPFGMLRMRKKRGQSNSGQLSGSESGSDDQWVETQRMQQQYQQTLVRQQMIHRVSA